MIRPCREEGENNLTPSVRRRKKTIAVLSAGKLHREGTGEASAKQKQRARLESILMLKGNSSIEKRWISHRERHRRKASLWGLGSQVDMGKRGMIGLTGEEK